MEQGVLQQPDSDSWVNFILINELVSMHDGIVIMHDGT
jgi:hypothetical protein